MSDKPKTVITTYQLRYKCPHCKAWPLTDAEYKAEHEDGKCQPSVTYKLVFK